jgi:hypothetical protein
MLVFMVKTAKRSVGRPLVDDPKDVQVRFRIDGKTAVALERYRGSNSLGDRSDAIRHILDRALFPARTEASK